MSEIDITVDLLREVLGACTNLERHRRNSFNDMLILATALRWGLEFNTDDRLLLELALRAEMIQTSCPSGRQPETSVHTTGKSCSLESKRYINSRWRTRRPGGPPP
ncbi:hypothetical protein [Nocardia sp. NPDC004711]